MPLKLAVTVTQRVAQSLALVPELQGPLTDEDENGFFGTALVAVFVPSAWPGYSPGLKFEGILRGVTREQGNVLIYSGGSIFPYSLLTTSRVYDTQSSHFAPVSSPGFFLS